MTMIIDAHAHVYPDKIAAKASQAVGSFYDTSITGTGTVEQLLATGERCGIDKFLIHSVATTPHQVESINRFISNAINKYPDKLIGFATTHPDHEDQQQVLEQAQEMGMQGVKLHPDFQEFPINDKRMWPVYAYCEKHNLPILFHTGDPRYKYSSPHLILPVLESFPDIRLICAHFGGWSQWDEAQEYLADTNVMVDCSSSFPFMSDERALELIECYGEDRIFFGSDFPMWDPGEELAHLRSLPLSRQTLEKILSGNLLRFLKTDNQPQPKA